MANKRMSYEEELNEEIDPIITESDVPEDGLDKESGVVDGVEALQIARIFQSLEDGDDPTMDPEAGEEDDEESDDTIKVKVSVDTGSDDEGGDDTTTEEEAAAESFWKSFEDDEEGGEEPAADEPAGDEGGDLSLRLLVLLILLHDVLRRARIESPVSRGDELSMPLYGQIREIPQLPLS